MTLKRQAPVYSEMLVTISQYGVTSQKTGTLNNSVVRTFKFVWRIFVNALLNNIVQKYYLVV